MGHTFDAYVYVPMHHLPRFRAGVKQVFVRNRQPPPASVH